MFKYPDVDFKVEGDVGYINGEIGIIFLPLSVSSNFKSSSYPDVNLIIFDEYVIAESVNKRYLKNEMILLFELIETIFRLRNDGKVLLLGNAISFVNPFFNFFNISIKDTNKRFHKFKDGLITVEIDNNENYVKEKEKTRFYQLLEGTNYQKYAFNNIALEDDHSFILEKRPKGLMFLCTYKYCGDIISIWLMREDGLYIDGLENKNTKKKYGVTDADITDGYCSHKKEESKYQFNLIKQCYFCNNVYFKNITIKKRFINILKHF